MKVLSPISRLLLCAVLLPSSACDKRESKVYGVIYGVIALGFTKSLSVWKKRGSFQHGTTTPV